jgi:DNA replication protein DnaC
MERIRPDDLQPPATDGALILLSGAPASGSTLTHERCRGCDDAGFYLLRVPYSHPDFGKLQPCECQAGRPLPGQVAMLARLRDELGHLADCTFDTFRTDRHLKEFVWDYDGKTYGVEVQRGDLERANCQALDYSACLTGWLYLFGNYGAGKSHLAAAVANTAAARGVRTTYASVPKLLDFIRAGYRDGSATARIESLQSVSLLVLDDLGTEAAKRDTDELLFQLLNHRSRERANLPTVITSNVHPDDLESRIADRIYGQTDGGARIVWMPIFSHRRLRP